MVAVISYNFLITGEERFSLLVGTGNQLTLLYPMRWVLPPWQFYTECSLHTYVYTRDTRVSMRNDGVTFVRFRRLGCTRYSWTSYSGCLLAGPFSELVIPTTGLIIVLGWWSSIIRRWRLPWCYECEVKRMALSFSL